nr:MAG: MC022.1L [Molluscum contagiosum virus]
MSSLELRLCLHSQLSTSRVHLRSFSSPFALVVPGRPLHPELDCRRAIQSCAYTPKWTRRASASE